MPLFEYRCADCAAVSEVLVGVGAGSNDQTVRCEHCGSIKVSKLLSRINIGRSLAAFSQPCGEAACPAPSGCCGGACHGH